jgi:hypothetical protein
VSGTGRSVESPVGVSTAAASPPRRDPAGAVIRSLGLDWFEVGCLAALVVVALAVQVPLLFQGRPLSGVEGIFPPDQTQYFAWVREAAHHGLIGNRFDLAPGARPFLHPGFGLSGLLHALTGIPIPLAYQLWKPVAIGVTFAGCLLYVRRLLKRTTQRRAALVIALFSVMPAVAFVAWSDWGGNPRQYTFDFISGEMWSGQYLWGYLMTSIAVFLVPLVLLGIESWRRSRRARALALCALGTLLIFWLQPWQGAVVVLIVAAVEGVRAIRTRERPPLALLVVPAAAALPAIYYFVLSQVDASWRLASESNAAGAQPVWSWPLWAVVLTLVPLAAPAALAYRLPARTWQEQAVRAWPLAALVVYLAPVGTFPYHAFQGLALPLGILAVQGVTSVAPRPRPELVAAALAFLTLPGLVHKLELPRNSIRDVAYPYYILPEEGRALDELERDPRPGGVLAAEYASNLVPYRTGRETYLGALSWSPDHTDRLRNANGLFYGQLRGARARAFVRRTHARFLLSSCRPSVDLTQVLGPLLRKVERFGCAALYELHPRPDMIRAAGAPDD